jgi:hypothetical protein
MVVQHTVLSPHRHFHLVLQCSVSFVQCVSSGLCSLDVRVGSVTGWTHELSDAKLCLACINKLAFVELTSPT